MNREDNIKKFFKKRLEDSSPADDLWNVPSDDIWNKAKVHFPKEQKKRRPFLFFILGLGSLLLLVGSVWWYTETTTDRQNDTSGIAKTEITKTEKNITTEIASLEKEKKENLIEEKAVEINPEEKSIEKIITSTQTVKQKRKPLPITEEDLSKSISNKLISEEVEELKTPIKNANEITRLEPASSIILQEEGLLALDRLPTRESTIETDEKEEKLKIDFVIKKAKRSRQRWEIGLSHSPFIVSPRKLIDSDAVEGEEKIELGFKYRNLNIPISRRFNRRWSLTSGVSYAYLGLNLDFELEEAYDMIPTDADLKSKLEENSSIGALSINDLSKDLGIVFTPDANLQNGDTLRLTGGIPLQLNIVQIPLLLNYHFGKGKVEGLLHTGAALDIITGKINTMDFNVYKGNMLITEPIDFEPVKDTFFSGSLYLGAGVKYHFSNRFNLGISSKIELTGLVLSRHEIGVYYGF